MPNQPQAVEPSQVEGCQKSNNAVAKICAFCDKFLEDQNCVTKFVSKVSQITSLHRRAVLLIMVALSAVYLATGVLAHTYSNLLCAGYPMVQAGTAMLADDSEQMVVWLLYLLVYTATTILEGSGQVLREVVPVYFVVRTGGFIYLYLPQTNGIGNLVDTWLKPFKKVKAGHADKETLESLHPAFRTMLGITPEVIESVNQNVELQEALRDLNLGDLLQGRPVLLAPPSSLAEKTDPQASSSSLRPHKVETGTKGAAMDSVVDDTQILTGGREHKESQRNDDARK